MDGVPYLQPLAGPEPQYVPWGVLLVRPIGHPPRPVPPRAVDQRSRAYPTLLHVLRWGRYGHRGGPKHLRLGPSPAFPVGPFRPPPPFRCVGCGGGFTVSPGWGGGGGGAAPRHSWPSCLCACPRHSWLRVLGVAPRHSWPGSSGVGGGVGRRHSWLSSAGLWGVVPRFRLRVLGGRSLATPG